MFTEIFRIKTYPHGHPLPSKYIEEEVLLIKALRLSLGRIVASKCAAFCHPWQKVLCSLCHEASKCFATFSWWRGENKGRGEWKVERGEERKRKTARENAPCTVPLSYWHRHTVKDLFFLRYLRIHPGPPSTVFLHAYCISSPIGT